MRKLTTRGTVTPPTQPVASDFAPIRSRGVSASAALSADRDEGVLVEKDGSTTWPLVALGDGLFEDDEVRLEFAADGSELYAMPADMVLEPRLPDRFRTSDGKLVTFLRDATGAVSALSVHTPAH